MAVELAAIADAVDAPDIESANCASWSANRIKEAVHDRGGTLRGISLAAGLRPGACSDALRAYSPRAERAIAGFLGVPVEELFAARYAAMVMGDTPTPSLLRAITVAVRARGTTLAALSRAAGLSAGACSHALTHASRRAERAIADCLGVPVEELWPARYATKKEAP